MVETVTSHSAFLGREISVRRIGAQQPWNWLGAGWKDIMAAGVVSLSWGLLFAIVGRAILAALHRWRLYNLALPLAAGFMLIAPVLVAGLYQVSRSLERKDPVSIATPFAAWRRHPGELGAMGIVLGLFFLAWMRIATLLFAGFFGLDTPNLGGEVPDLRGFIESVILSGRNATFLIVSTAIGAVLAFIVFALSVIAVPMLVDRDVGVFEAMATSIAAVKLNLWPLIVWAILVVLFTVAGLAVGFVGLTVTLPLIAHATWHAYRDLVPPPKAAAAVSLSAEEKVTP
ncbi:MAG: DUF2189 domain-containing protein [Bauldia litoralis]